MTLFDSASSCSDGSTSSAASHDDSSWRNITTNSGVAGSCRQYAFWPSFWMCVAHLARVVGHAGRARRVVGALLVRAEVAGERHLRVDHDRLAAGQLHDHVGAEHAAVVARDRLLLVEVAVGQHPGHLDHPPQLDLAPAAARVRVRRAAR